MDEERTKNLDLDAGYAVAYGEDYTEAPTAGTHQEQPHGWVEDDYDKARNAADGQTEQMNFTAEDDNPTERMDFSSSNEESETADKTQMFRNPQSEAFSYAAAGPAKKSNLLPVLLALLLAFNLALAGAVVYLLTDRGAGPHYTVSQGNADNEKLLESSGAVTNVANDASSAVVKIETTVQNSESGDSWFNEYYRYFFGIPETEQIQTGLGSGFLISEDGYILTNEHVVDGASEITVTINGYDDPFAAELIGYDYDMDLAVLKIEAKSDLPHLVLGDSDSLNVGDWVVAIGNPYGLDHTVTLGVISAKSREVTVEDRNFENLLQTDASINPGNSGGPLLDLNGNVIGINNAVSEDAQGIGFAIPINNAKEVLDELIENGKVSTPWLGINMQAVTEDIASYFGAKAGEGVLVASVYENSAAAAAGLQQYDIILQINNQDVNAPEDIQEIVSNSEIGDKLKMLVLREGQRIAIDAEVGEK